MLNQAHQRPNATRSAACDDTAVMAVSREWPPAEMNGPSNACGRQMGSVSVGRTPTTQTQCFGAVAGRRGVLAERRLSRQARSQDRRGAERQGRGAGAAGPAAGAHLAERRERVGLVRLHVVVAQHAGLDLVNSKLSCG